MDKLFIYQLNDTESNRSKRGMSYRELRYSKKIPMLGNYNLVYTTDVLSGRSLESIYEDYNRNLPEDFTGYSLSVSDMVVIQNLDENDKNYQQDISFYVDSEPPYIKAYYVDKFGFVECPNFAIQHIHQKRFEAGYYYGYVEFLGTNGTVGETMYFKEKESFKKELSESYHLGRPINSFTFPELSEFGSIVVSIKNGRVSRDR